MNWKLLNAKVINMENLTEVAEVSLAYSLKIPASERPKIGGSPDVFNLLKDSWENIDFVETFKVILLSRANKVLGIYEHSKGGGSGTVIDCRNVMQSAVLSNAHGIILAHNHPGGQLKPSEADIRITEKLKAGGQFLGIAVLDHVILTSEGYYSMSDEGII